MSTFVSVGSGMGWYRYTHIKNHCTKWDKSYYCDYFSYISLLRYESRHDRSVFYPYLPVAWWESSWYGWHLPVSPCCLVRVVMIGVTLTCISLFPGESRHDRGAVRTISFSAVSHGPLFCRIYPASWWCQSLG